MDYAEIDVETAARHLEVGDTLFVDVRDRASFEAGHVPGAIHLDDQSIEDFLEETERDRRVVVYCYHGHSSLGGAAYLREQGFADVASMSGGYEAWRVRKTHPTSPG